MDRILKYDLVPMIANFIPSGDVLLIDEQERKLRIWVTVDENSVEETQYFVLPTGTQVKSQDLMHVGSATTSDGFVWHVFRKDN